MFIKKAMCRSSEQLRHAPRARTIKWVATQENNYKESIIDIYITIVQNKYFMLRNNLYSWWSYESDLNSDK